MSRQINLYSSAFRAKPKRFTALWVVVAAAVMVAASLGYYELERQRVKQVQLARSTTEAQLKQLREQVVALGKQGQKPIAKEIEEQVARAEALQRTRQELLGSLQSGEFGNREGYAKYLEALARQRLEGVWLTSIEISGAKSEFAIKGRALRGDLLPGYIKMLRNEEAFRGKSISTLAMREIEIDPKGEQKPPAGPGAGTPMAAQAQGGPGGQPAQPMVRVVEFSIGTEGATPPKEAAEK